jgi:SAM-dependent methyltransferase
MSFGTFDENSRVTQDGVPIVNPRQFAAAENHIFFKFFDEVQHVLSSQPEERTAHAALDQLFCALRDRKLNAAPADWSEFVVLCRQHPLMKLLHEDAFTYRAFSKPRGYAGDAVMMDYIYGREERWPKPEMGPIGEHVFNFTTSAPASEGVRARRAYVAMEIDRMAEERRGPHILAIASGHLREAMLCAAVRRRKVGRFLALDADALSAAEVERAYGPFGVETVTSSFRRLFGHHGDGQFDLVYSTGLFDYLAQRMARRLVNSMFSMLRPGGKLFVANFLPGVRDVGYMETLMDWNLIYRSRRDMVDLTMDIPEEEIKEINLISEECKNIVFLQLTRN